MAKKPKKLKTKATEITATQKDSLAYQGKVKFQILHGNRVVSTKNYTNNGLPELFKFLGFALAGSYYNSLRPCKVALYDCLATGEYKDPTKFNWTEYSSNSVLEPVSPFVVYDATPVVKADREGYSTTFRFKIPFNWLYKKQFNTLGLFTEDDVACAYYLFTVDTPITTEDGKPAIQKDWNPQTLTEETGDYSIVIEWTLKISNK